MQKELKFGLAEVLVDFPLEQTNTALLFIPGVSGKGRSERFSPLVAVALEKGYAIARVDMWDSPEGLSELSLADILSSLTDVVSGLSEIDLTRIILVGKSFGGGLALAFDHLSIVQKIGWAPAFGVGDSSNILEVATKKFAEFETTREIHLGRAELNACDIPIGIIHGTADESIPIENSREIIASVRKGTLIEIPNADHSFKTPESEEALMNATKGLLQ